MGSIAGRAGNSTELLGKSKFHYITPSRNQKYPRIAHCPALVCNSVDGSMVGASHLARQIS